MLQIVKQIDEQIDDILGQSIQVTSERTDVQIDWLMSVSSLLGELTTLETRTLMGQAKILHSVWSVWEANNNVDGVCLNAEAKSLWESDYYRWAKSYTQNTSIEPSDVTIWNKVSVYDNWVANPIIEPPEYVFVPKRDEKDQLVDPNLATDEAWEKIEFDPDNCDYSKLLVCRKAAKANELTPEAWSAVADPFSTVEDLKKQMKKPTSGNQTPDTFAIVEEDGIIYGIEDGERVAVLHALFENQCPLFNKTLTHILKAAGLKIPMQYR